MDSSRLGRTVAIATMAAGIACPAAADATTRYVKQGGATSGSCLTSATACRYSRVLNDAAGPTQPGDTVIVESGTYDVSAAEVLVQEQVHVVGSGVGPRPVFTGSDNNSPTFKLIAPAGGSTLTNLDIRATGSGSTALWADVAITGQQLTLSSNSICAYLNAPGSTLRDATGTATAPGSACITAAQPNTTLRNLDVTQSNAFGTALYMGGSGSTAEDLVVTSAGEGALIANTVAGERVVVRRSVFSAVGFHGVTAGGGPVLITDSVLRSGGAGGSALSVTTGDTQIRNVTAIATGSNSDAVRIESGPPGSQANLLARNVLARGVYAGIVIEPGKPDPLCVAMPPGSCIYPDHVPGTAGRSHSNVGSALGGVQDLGGNVNGPPGFVDQAAGDYRLVPGSTSIDAGTADPLNGPLDLDGRPRTLGAAPDMGAYEFDPGPAPPGGGADTTAPVLLNAHLTNRVFARTRRATPVNARAKRGTKFVYGLSEAAVVTIKLQRRVAGRRKGGRCVKPTRKLARAKRCRRYVAAGKLTRAGAAGKVSVPFTGRVGRRALPLGSYRATLTATDLAGNRSGRSRVTFRIVRR